MPFPPKLQEYIEQREKEQDQISDRRVSELTTLAEYITACKKEQKPVLLNFICTHNSRRSQLGQIWAAIAAVHFGIREVETYSGGTEATAFNPRAIAALQRAGITIEPLADTNENPRYKVTFAEAASEIVCFSKKYGSKPNPSTGFCAVMTCSQADESCPLVSGAAKRISIAYEDPKVADNTPEEEEAYADSCAQIAREILYAFSFAAELDQ